MKIKFFSFIIFFLVANNSIAQCIADFDLGNDTTLCVNESFNLNINNIYDSYTWQDNSSISSFLVNQAGTYYCTSSLANNVNLINNGGFEQGNTLFTTDYTYYPIADVFGPQASYGIINNANTWFNPFNACLDHTSGSGLMMVIDGSAFNGGNDAIWCQSIPVEAGTKYKFSYWIQSVTNSNILANIQTRINGVVESTELAPLGACNWQEREVVWTSAITANVNFCLYDLELAGNGNDFALDDISLVQICEYNDTIVVSLNPMDTSNVVEEICFGDSLFLEGAWQTQAGFYYDAINGQNCMEILETELSFSPIDTTKELTEICFGDSLFLAGSWQTLTGFYYDIIPNPNCTGVLETELVYSNIDTTRVSKEICETDSFFVAGQWQKNAGVYYDLVPGNPCNGFLETTLIVNPLPNADAGNDITISYEQIVTLSASPSSFEESFLWTSSNNFMSTEESIDIEVLSLVQTFYLELTENGCSDIDSVTIYGVPLNLEIRVPNAFTPNSDNTNDIFRLINPDEFQQIEMKIYNRWGELIYKQDGVNPSWEGEYLDGRNCPIDTYAFFIEAQPYGNIEKMNLSGNLSLIR